MGAWMNKTLGSLLLISVLAAVSCPASADLSASSDAIRGKVVDDATGQPLAGVLVIATWHDFTEGSGPGFMHQGGGVYYSCYQLVNVVTAVSKADGSYVLPAWQGKTGRCRSMNVEQPLIGLYKPGYDSVQPIEVPLQQAYKAGPDHSVSRWDGYTFQMHPLGPHYYSGHGDDNHVLNLDQYVRAVTLALSDDEKGPCFWDEIRPELLLLMQEQRRLSAYGAADVDAVRPEYGISLVPRCGTAAQVAALKQEAEATPVEQPAGSLVRTTEAGEPGAVMSLSPKQLQDYLAEADAPGHEGDAGVIVYHATLDPKNPYYAAFAMIGPPADYPHMVQIPGVYDPQAREREQERQRRGVYGLDCPSHEPEPVREYMMSSDGKSHPVPPSLTSVAAAGSSPGKVQLQCSWTVGFLPKPESTEDLMQDMRLPSDRHQDYDKTDGTWYLTERSLPSDAHEPLPGILELHNPPSSSLKVVTTLQPAGQDRWRLPPAGQPFTLAISSPPPGAVTDACVQALPDTLRLQLARDFAEFRLVHASELAAGAAGCADVVTGDFTGKGQKDYAFHLMENGLIQRLAIATPKDTAWSIITLGVKGCIEPKHCALTSAAPGRYVRTWIPWMGDSDTLRDGSDSGKRLWLQATNPGFMESWDAVVAYVHFFVDGKWQYVVVAAPKPAAH